MASNYDGGSQYGDRPRQSQEQAQREPHLLNLKVNWIARRGRAVNVIGQD